MPITAQCDSCFREYRLEDHLAGKKIRCKECGEVIAVPSARRGGSGGGRGRRPRPAARPQRARRDDYEPDDFGDAAPRSRGRSKGGTNKTLMTIGAIIGGVALFGVLGCAGLYFISSMNSGVTIDGPIAEEFKTKYGDDHAITLVVHDVPADDAEAAKKYLLSRIAEQAKAIYQKEKQRADQITGRNKREAENAARDRGDIMYRYREEESKYRSTHTVLAVEDGSTLTFLATPVDDAAAFVSSLKIGSVDSSSGREYHVKASLPDPIPDPEVEGLRKHHGYDRVYQFALTGASGNEEDVKNYVAMHVYLARNEGRFYANTATVMDCIRGARIQAWKSKGNGRYEFTLAPVDKPDQLAAAIDFGVANIDHSRRVINIAAQLPNPVPTIAELTAAREKVIAEQKAIAAAEAARKAEERRIADEKRAADKAIRDADWAKRPRPGETELEWATRIMEADDAFAVPVVLAALVKMEVPEDSKLEVATILGKKFGNHRYPIDKLLPAFKKWCPEEQFEPTLIQWLKADKFGRSVDPIFTELAASKSEAALAAIAGTLESTFVSRKAIPILKSLGPVAEDAVLPGTDHADQQVRTRVYEVLAAIGTTKSVKILKGNIRKESVFMKRKAEDCLRAIEARGDKAPDEPNS